MSNKKKRKEKAKRKSRSILIGCIFAILIIIILLFIFVGVSSPEKLENFYIHFWDNCIILLQKIRFKLDIVFRFFDTIF